MSSNQDTIFSSPYLYNFPFSDLDFPFFHIKRVINYLYYEKRNFYCISCPKDKDCEDFDAIPFERRYLSPSKLRVNNDVDVLEYPLFSEKDCIFCKYANQFRERDKSTVWPEVSLPNIDWTKKYIEIYRQLHIPHHEFETRAIKSVRYDSLYNRYVADIILDYVAYDFIGENNQQNIINFIKFLIDMYCEIENPSSDWYLLSPPNAQKSESSYSEFSSTDSDSDTSEDNNRFSVDQKLKEI